MKTIKYALALSLLALAACGGLQAEQNSTLADKSACTQTNAPLDLHETSMQEPQPDLVLQMDPVSSFIKPTIIAAVVFYFFSCIGHRRGLNDAIADHIDPAIDLYGHLDHIRQIILSGAAGAGPFARILWELQKMYEKMRIAAPAGLQQTLAALSTKFGGISGLEILRDLWGATIGYGKDYYETNRAEEAQQNKRGLV